MKLQLPNLLTSLNLFCGCIAVVMVFRNHLDFAAYFVFAAAIFDLFDGMVARKVLSNPEFGKEFDSLADVLSFGFVPAAVLFKLLQYSDMASLFHSEIVFKIAQFIPFLITIFSALRLAKFNIDTRQTNSFIGLPTPANTLFIVSLPLIIKQQPGKFDFIILNPFFILSVTVVFSFLLISELPLFSLKFKNFTLKENIYQYILIVLGVILFPLFLYAAIPMIIILYIILSVVQNKTTTKTLV